MFERWTDRARRAIVLAEQEARLLNHNYVGTEHVLLGLIREGEDAAFKALESLGVTLEAARAQVEEIVGRGQQEPPAGVPFPFTPRVRKVLELAMREALQLGVSYVATEHILLALDREGEGYAMKVLANLGAAETVRSAVLAVLRGYAKAEGAHPAPKPAIAYVHPPTLADVLTAIEGLGSRLGAIERHLGIAAEPPSGETEA